MKLHCLQMNTFVAPEYISGQLSYSFGQGSGHWC